MWLVLDPHVTLFFVLCVSYKGIGTFISLINSTDHLVSTESVSIKHILLHHVRVSALKRGLDFSMALEHSLKKVPQIAGSLINVKLHAWRRWHGLIKCKLNVAMAWQ